MPLWKFRTFEEAEAHLDQRPTSPDASLGTALFLLSISEAARRGIRTAQRGVVCYRDLEEGEADRRRFALEQMRRAPVESSSRSGPEGDGDSAVRGSDAVLDQEWRG